MQLQENHNLVFIPGQNEHIALRSAGVPGRAEFSEFSEHSESGEMPVRPVLIPGKKGDSGSKGLSAGMANDTSAKTGAEKDRETEMPLNEQEQLLLRKEIIREYDALRQQYISEGEKARLDAQEWAQRLIETTENDIRKLYAKNETDCAELRKNADEQGFRDGYDRGFSEGDERGYEEGYNKALRKCKDTLKELLAALEVIDNEREKYFREYESRLFDAVFTIANKITVDSLKQKDKSIITKMLREAAKGFRNSDYVKVTLSKLDASQFGTAGLDELKDVFRESQHIEFEVVKDAPSGTLIIDNGSEITDAGVATQLMMIEKLGKGKFRDKEEEVK
ncbi:MAG: hypothetical protein FWG70_09205 [Oscillospiraceae bacterium]|nr:hypothetical protein [Oscillospiraceae bacterium]